MDISIIVIGDELLLGRVTDTNSGVAARLADARGWRVTNVETVGDSAGAITEAVNRALDRSRVVLMTGGLGPTKDDITKQVMYNIFGGDPVCHPEALANVKRIFADRGLQLNDLTLSQAVIPSSCQYIPNAKGTAPGMWFETPDGRVLVAMPGVPFETAHMLEAEVMPRLEKIYGRPDKVTHHTFIISGISESALAEHLDRWESALPPHCHLAYLPERGWLRLRLDISGDQPADRELAELRQLIAPWLIAEGELPPAALLLQELRQRGLTVGTAESCTGGSIAAAITAIPGSSDCMKGGVVAYANAVKTGVLGVDPTAIEALGAVSLPVVEQMTAGAAKVLGADLTIATSGIAGPGGGTPDKPVGTVCLAVRLGDLCEAKCLHMPGDRAGVVKRTVDTALLEAIRLLSIF